MLSVETVWDAFFGVESVQDPVCVFLLCGGENHDFVVFGAFFEETGGVWADKDLSAVGLVVDQGLVEVWDKWYS